MAATVVTVALAQARLLLINGKTTQKWWTQRAVDEATTMSLVDRLNEIVMSGQAGSVDDTIGRALGAMYTTCGLA